MKKKRYNKIKRKEREEKEDKRNRRSIKLDGVALSRCGPGIRRLLLMTEEEITRTKKKDERRIRIQLEHIKKQKPIKKGEKRRKMPPTLYKDFLKREIKSLPHPVFGPVIIDKLPKIPIKIRAIVNFAGNADDLEAMGIKVNSHIQNIFTIKATRNQLQKLAFQNATQKIRLPRIFFPYLDDAVRTAEIDQIHAVGTRGNGTIVGIVDSALHVEHHAFCDPIPPHNTRVLFMWIQDPDTGPGGAMPPGQNPEDYFNDPNHPNSPDFTGLDYGILYDADAINTALGLANTYGTGVNQIAKEPDNVSPEHGTHVAGIAAGSGHNGNWNQGVNIGSAPQADIVHVCYRWSYANAQSGVFEDDVIRAIDFVMRVADQRGQPVVFNASLGTNLGPHNGCSEFDQARDALLDSFLGRSIVFSAGNDNNDEGFRKGSIPAATVAPVTMSFDMRPIGYDTWLDIWYSGPDLDFKMDCGTDTTGWQVSPNEFHGNVNGYDIDVDRDVEAGGGMKSIRLYVQNPGADWTIRLRNSSGTEIKYWAWIGVQGWWADLDGFAINEMTLGDTGCGKSIITIGACDKPVGGNPEDIADYSGCGPTLDGRIKPEIVAVGTGVQSANSTTAGGYIGKTGTSMAAPLVAGAIALLFENEPDLNQDSIKALLTQTADRTGLNIDPGVPGYDPIERNAYGFGRLRMLAPFQHSLPLVNVDVWARTADDDYGFEPYPGGCFCHAPEVQVLDSGGNETNTLNWGQEHTVKVRVYNLGDTPAIGTLVKLKYTRPWAAPDDWVECQDSANNAIEETVNIPALGYVDLTFTQRWKPETSELPLGGAGWGDHYCLLVELNHQDDPLQYDDSTAAGKDPWTKNIKGTNNVALRNINIH
jgi:subtilisin family serine protease